MKKNHRKNDCMWKKRRRKQTSFGEKKEMWCKKI